MMWALAMIGLAGAQELWTTNVGTDELVIVDVQNFTKTPVGPLGVNKVFGGLTYDPHADVFYSGLGRLGLGGTPDDRLVQIDPSTGAATVIGSTGLPLVEGLAYDPHRRELMAVFEDRSWGPIDTSTAQVTPIGVLPVRSGGMTYAPQFGGIVLLNRDIDTQLFVMDVDLGIARPLYQNRRDGGLLLTAAAGFAWDPGSQSYYANYDNQTITTYDPFQGFASAPYWYRVGKHQGWSSMDVPTDPVSIDILGACGAPQVLTAEGLTPNEPVALLVGSLGSGTIGVGPCQGELNGLVNSRLAARGTADGAGDLSMPLTLPPIACGRGLQLVDVGTCRVSNMVRP